MQGVNIMSLLKQNFEVKKQTFKSINPKTYDGECH